MIVRSPMRARSGRMKQRRKINANDKSDTVQSSSDRYIVRNEIINWTLLAFKTNHCTVKKWIIVHGSEIIATLSMTCSWGEQSNFFSDNVRCVSSNSRSLSSHLSIKVIWVCTLLRNKVNRFSKKRFQVFVCISTSRAVKQYGLPRFFL